MAVSRKEDLVAVGAQQGLIEIHGAVTGDLLHSLPGLTAEVTKLVFARDGHLLAALVLLRVSVRACS